MEREGFATWGTAAAFGPALAAPECDTAIETRFTVQQQNKSSCENTGTDHPWAQMWANREAYIKCKQQLRAQMCFSAVKLNTVFYFDLKPI